MSELKPRIHDEANGLDYILAGDYYIPAIELPVDDERPIGKWGRMHRAYLEETNPLLLNHLILTGKLHTGSLSAYHQADSCYRRRDRGLEAAVTVGMDKRHEQYCQPSRGNYQKRVNLYINRYR